MQRRILAALLATLFAAVALAGPAEASWYDAHLRTWDWNGPIQDRWPLRLAPTEAYDRYYFAVQATSGVVVAYFTVQHDATGDSVCSGDLSHAGDLAKNHRCDLRVGHDYTVVIHMVGFGKTHLYGVNV